MRFLANIVFAIVSIGAFSSAQADIDVNVACLGDSRGDGSSAYENARKQTYDALIENGVDMAHVCAKPYYKPATSSNVDQGPVRLSANMMAQFYAVSESRISVSVIDQTAQTAKVSATAPGGKRCVFELVKAPAGADVPSGWLSAAPDCVVNGGGMPVIDGAAVERAKKAAAFQMQTLE